MPPVYLPLLGDRVIKPTPTAIKLLMNQLRLAYSWVAQIFG
jgi:hypothetical protein